jgi:hypothetical protein
MAAVVVLFLGVLTTGAVLYTAAVMKFFDRSRNTFREKEAALELLDLIVLRFEDLVREEADDAGHPVLERLRSDYAGQSLSIVDVSSGCNLNFLPEADLSDPALAAFLFASGSAEPFFAFRKIRGFVTDAEEWTPFLKEEALRSVVSSGWFSAFHVDSETFAMLAASFGRGDAAGLYPLVNKMPLINVNTVDPALLKPLLSRSAWRVPNAGVKAAALTSRLERGPLTGLELRSILGLPESHRVFRYLGVKSAFWRIRFTSRRYRVAALIAAVPGKGREAVERYQLVESRLER